MTSISETHDDQLLTLVPDKKVSVRETFGVDVDMTVPAFSHRDSHVPEIDTAYRFDPETTKAICPTQGPQEQVCGQFGGTKMKSPSSMSRYSFQFSPK